MPEQSRLRLPCGHATLDLIMGDGVTCVGLGETSLDSSDKEQPVQRVLKRSIIRKSANDVEHLILGEHETYPLDQCTRPQGRLDRSVCRLTLRGTAPVHPPGDTSLDGPP